MIISLCIHYVNLFLIYQRKVRLYCKKILIYDFIVFPTDSDVETYTSIVSKELPRFAEFANSSLTSSEAKNKILPYLSPYNLNYLMDMKPWDVYYSMKEEQNKHDQ